MSTVNQKLKHLWIADFEDGKRIFQPANDRYSKHVDGAEHNPSAFRDILDYEATGARLKTFSLANYDLELATGNFFCLDGVGIIGRFNLEDTPLTDRKLIFFREVRQEFKNGTAQPPYVNRYCMGYEGKNFEGKVEKKVIYLDG